MRILSVVGTRPQLIKAAVLQPVLRSFHEEVFVDTGQHWDDALAGAFFRELGLARPDHSLAAGGGSNAHQTAAMLLALEPILAAARPDAVLVYGDTNSTLAGALAAAKAGLPVAHVEAGLRSFDRRMPEEVNRVVVDHLSTWCFAPTATAVANLSAEGIRDGVWLVGDLMHDLVVREAAAVRDSSVLGDIAGALQAEAPGLRLEPGRYLFATVHRAENREPAAVRAWAAVLRRVARPSRPVVLAIHPGTREALDREGASLGGDVRVVGPLDYRSSLALQLHAAAVLTDSGGVQREAAWLGTPCLVLRTSTEWTEAVEGSGGQMVLIGTNATKAARELERVAPQRAAAALARARAHGLRLDAVGAAELIARTLGTSGGRGSLPAPSAS